MLLHSFAIAPPTEHVFVCTDGSPAMRPAIGTATLVAERTGAALHLLHVQERDEAAHRARRDTVERTAAELGATADILTAGRGRAAAHPALPIGEYLGGFEAALPCTSTHGRNGVGQTIFGSVTAELVRGGGLPVLVLGPSAVAPERLSRVVACTDGSAFAAEILPAAAGLARDLDVPLWIVEVLDADRAPRDGDVAESATVRRLAHDLASTGLDVEWDVLHGRDTVAAIGRFADLQPGTVTALATHGRGGVVGTLVGSVARAVTRHTAGPTLIYRPKSLDAPTGTA
ncbi:MAG: hypothetical protein GEV08_00360 [Acidimicrobiia bacterium]|nr:hypothetical protein [Acidimicrobiia bacterium]